VIVPSNRLLFWIAVIVLPFAFLAAVVPVALGLCLCIIALLLILVLVDAALATRALGGISVELPAVARMSKDRDSMIDVRIRNPDQKRRTLRFGLPLPRQIESVHEDEIITLPAESEWSHFKWHCRPQLRGNYRLQTACLEARSVLGFWSFRKRVPVASEVRVYPNLLTERRNLAALFLHRGSFGFHAQRQVGKGRDFEKLREYSSGDSFDEIHWKATARRGKPITKVFQIERTQEVYVIIDASRLSARNVAGGKLHVAGSPEVGLASEPSGTNDQASTILESFITAGLILGLAAEQQGDLFGLLTFTDQIERFVRARNGKAHYSSCRDALYTLQPKVVTPDFDELCSFIRLRLRRRALLFFLTSLDDSVVAESFVRNLDLIRRQHLVMVSMLSPAAVAPVFTDPNIMSLDQVYQHLGGHLLWHNLRELGKVLQRRGVHFSLLKHERLSAELVSQYLSVKQRQLL
jgi:uncharacterized protein (DUF58 family)